MPSMLKWLHTVLGFSLKRPFPKFVVIFFEKPDIIGNDAPIAIVRDPGGLDVGSTQVT